ncbi:MULTISPECIES: hypothetical protein [unclassified Nostoc]|nr:hypothetical protein [Nostoc sp. KVJ3]
MNERSTIQNPKSKIENWQSIREAIDLSASSTLEEGRLIRGAVSN